jgi:kynurenine formamidase
VRKAGPYFIRTIGGIVVAAPLKIVDGSSSLLRVIVITG